MHDQDPSGHGAARPEIGASEIKALVLDDSSFDRRRIRRLAGEMPLTIQFNEVSSIDGLDAVLDQNRFDIIFLDYHLPSGDGMEALGKVRAHMVNADCPAIMLTGHDTSELAVRSIKGGCNDYLSKDQLTSRTLANCIAGVLEGESVGDIPDINVLQKEQVLATAMQRYVKAIEPKVARAVQDVRAARKMAGKAQPLVNKHLAGVEQQCLKIWSALVDPRTVSDPGEWQN